MVQQSTLYNGRHRDSAHLKCGTGVTARSCDIFVRKIYWEIKAI